MLFDHTLEHVSAENWTSLDVRCLLARSTGTAPPKGAATVADCLSGGMVELSDTAYVRKTLSGLAVVDLGDADRGLDANSVTWTALGGTQSTSGVLTYIFVTDDSDHIPIFWHPKSPAILTNGEDLTVAWATAGLCTLVEV